MTTSHTSTGVECVCVVNPAGDFAGFDECGRIVWGTLNNAQTFVRDSELSMDCAEEFLASCRLVPECGGSRFVDVTTYRAEESKIVERDTTTSPTPHTQGTPMQATQSRLERETERVASALRHAGRFCWKPTYALFGHTSRGEYKLISHDNDAEVIARMFLDACLLTHLNGYSGLELRCDGVRVPV